MCEEAGVLHRDIDDDDDDYDDNKVFIVTIKKLNFNY